MRKNIYRALFALFFMLPLGVFATIGVGVGTGKITVKDKLKPGIIYDLPSLTVVNTGDEASEYEASISYHEKQKELRPDQKWFTFSPRTFQLAPGKAQSVKIRLDLPLNTAPGDYFAYIEGHPLKKSTNGSTSVGIAAASKLYFAVVPASLFQAVYYKALALWTLYFPWSLILVAVIVLILVIVIFKKTFTLQISMGKKKNE